MKKTKLKYISIAILHGFIIDLITASLTIEYFKTKFIVTVFFYGFLGYLIYDFKKWIKGNDPVKNE